MFQFNTKSGKLKYDLWVLANNWNKFANSFAQFQTDSAKTAQKIAKDFSFSSSRLTPSYMKTK